KRAASGRCAKVSFFSGGQSHLATVAPASSNRSGRGDNETAEASDGKGRTGDPASGQALTRVNAEQAPKVVRRKPTLRTGKGNATRFGSIYLPKRVAFPFPVCSA